MIRRFFVLFFLFLPLLAHAALSYKVKFLGVKDLILLKKIQNNSQLVALKEHPPRSINALRYRAEADIPEILKLLHSYGYYDAKITTNIERGEKNVKVYLFISLGTRYLLKTYNIYEYSEKSDATTLLNEYIPLDDLNISLNKPFSSEEILASKLKLLSLLAEKGYPLATIEKQDVIVDVSQKIVNVSLYLKIGLLCRFGSISISGIKDIKPSFILKKLDWKEGEFFSTSKIKEAQEKLITSDLFSSVVITQGGQLDEDGTLPIKVDVVEAKHKNISIGASYATIDGFGADFGWTNRNVHGLGELLSIDANVAQNLITGQITYKKPDFLRIDQDFIFQMKAARENISPYLAKTYTINTRLDRKEIPLLIFRGD